MDFSFFEKLNIRKFKKMTFLGHKPRRLVLYQGFNNFISRIIDGGTIQKNFDKIYFLKDDFRIADPSFSYAFIIPPEIEVLRHIKFIYETAHSDFPAIFNDGSKFYIELWFQPRVNNVVNAWMVDMDFAPKSILDTFPSKDCPSSSKEGKIPCPRLEVSNLELDVTPLDDDVLTIESPYSFVRAWSLRDLTVVSEVRQALDVIRSHTGFSCITAIGTLATAVAKTLNKPSPENQTQLIIIDRSVDLITPTITQMNYEGIIAEFFGIDCGLVKVSSEKGDQLQLLSSKEDNLFGQMRSMNLQEASTEIDRRTKAVNSTFNQKKGDTMEEGMAKFRNTAKVSVENKTLIDHFNLTQKALEKMEHSKYLKKIMNEEANALSGLSSIKPLVTSMLETGDDFLEIVRILSLESLLKGGFDKDYPKYVNQIIFNYGFQMILYLIRLQDTGFFAQTSYKWIRFVNNFQLFVPDWDTREPRQEEAASYLGYVPLTIRYIQKVLAGEFDVVSKAVSEIGQQSYDTNSENKAPRRSGNVLVCFIGGCTHSELNALRRLELHDSSYRNVTFQVLTTNMTSSKDFFKNLSYMIPGWKSTI